MVTRKVLKAIRGMGKEFVFLFIFLASVGHRSVARGQSSFFITCSLRGMCVCMHVYMACLFNIIHIHVQVYACKFYSRLYILRFHIGKLSLNISHFAFSVLHTGYCFQEILLSKMLPILSPEMEFLQYCHFLCPAHIKIPLLSFLSSFIEL